MREYKLEESVANTYLITYIENGRVWTIPQDEDNADYQRYLIDTDGGLPIPGAKK